MRNREITAEGKLTLIVIEVILLVPIAYMFHYLKINHIDYAIASFGIFIIEMLIISIFALYRLQKQK